jgi:hypothetical protein
LALFRGAETFRAVELLFALGPHEGAAALGAANFEVLGWRRVVRLTPRDDFHVAGARTTRIAKQISLERDPIEALWKFALVAVGRVQEIPATIIAANEAVHELSAPRAKMQLLRVLHDAADAGDQPVNHQAGLGQS